MSFIYSKYFPYPTIREQQTEAIDFILDSFINQNKKFVILEAGTGVGKSAIGLTVARYLAANWIASGDKSPGAYFLTTQKILQQTIHKRFWWLLWTNEVDHVICQLHMFF